MRHHGLSTPTAGLRYGSIGGTLVRHVLVDGRFAPAPLDAAVTGHHG